MRICLVALLLASGAYPQTIERAEALWRARQYDAAGKTFEALVKANDRNADYKARYGRLLLERFNPVQAAGLFQEALEIKKDHAGALLGLALVAADGFDSKAGDLARAALASDPKLVEAQELLARLALEDNNPAKAIAEADKALAISPKALDAMAIRAAVDLLADKNDTPWIGRILAIDPKYGEAYEAVGYFFVQNRRYEEGIEFYRKAIALKPDLWSARSQLGINLMRLGIDQEAKEQLETAFNNGYKDKPTTNTLNLMESYKNFLTFKTDNTVLRLHRKEAELLRPYFESELKRAIATFEKKYKIKLDRPVQVEVYPDHEDFAVRTMGMPGLGALGVTFGYVVAMDSPSGRKPGSFHWDSTMWHELSHVFVLAATKHKVPRWFTEGMAVHEETAASPDWGDRLDPQAITAIKDKKLLPVADLDRGFIHPTYPTQVVVSYFQAGRICDYVKKNWGYDKLLAMMNDFGRGMTTPEVIQEELGMKPEEFDKKFLAALTEDTKRTVEGFAEWPKKVRAISELAKANRHDDVIREGLAIRDLYPDYVEAGSVYEFLADAYLAKGDKPHAMAELARYSEVGGRDPGLVKKLATLLEEAGRKGEAAAALTRLNWIYPNDEDLHRRLGGLQMDSGKPEAAVVEFRAAVAMKPLDTATARYNLARALKSSGKDDEAKEELLLALETAPGFRPAAENAARTIKGRENIKMTPLAPTQTEAEQLKRRITRFREVEASIVKQVRRVIVGQEEVLEQVMIALFVGGHCLITGLPGTAKTLLVRTMAQTLGLIFKRIQFTPDLMPSDMTGTDIIEEDQATGRRSWTFVQGPIFANVLLADEINRTPPKTQSALLEAMQERRCTVRGNNYVLPAPFFVLATQNPIELEGTYPLPEAQLDRFLFNTVLDYLTAEEEMKVVDLTTTTHVAEADPVTSAEEILEFQQLVRMVPIGDSVARYAIDLVRMSRPSDETAPDFVKKYINYGASVRAAQFLVLAAKARALVKNRYHVTYEDIRALYVPILRHRVLLNFHAESDKLKQDDLLKRVLEAKPAPKGD